MKRQPRVERDRLRERERQARAQMSAQAEREAEPVGAPVFGAPVRVTPSAGDRVTQQIQSRLGNYDRVKQLLEDEPKLLIGITGAGSCVQQPPPPPQPPSSSSSSSSMTTSEFKKPASHFGSGGSGGGRVNSHHHHQGQPRGGFVKPADGKPPYGGRGGYPGQPVKHGGGSNDHRSNGILPAKGPPIPPNRIHQASKNLPRLQVEQGPTARDGGQGDQLENILKEMRRVTTPLSGIATPRKETETKFTFNPILQEFSEARPQQLAHDANSINRPHRAAPPSTTQPPPDLLNDDLSLSEDSDDEKDEPKTCAQSSSPAGRMEQNTQLIPGSPEVVRVSPIPSSSSDSDSGSESESSSAESEIIPVVVAETATPAAISPLPQAEEEAKPRWNLGSFLKKPPDDAPKTSPQLSSPNLLPESRNNDDSDDSNKDLDIVVQEALQKPQPLLSSFSDSDEAGKKVAVGKAGRRQRKSTASEKKAAAACDSDSDTEVKQKPRFPKRSYVRKSRAERSASEDGRGKRKPSRKPPRTPSGSEDEGVKKPKAKRPQPLMEEEKRKRPRGRPPKEPKIIVDSSDDEWKVKVKRREEVSADKKKEKIRAPRQPKKHDLKIKSKERCPTPTSDSDSEIEPAKVRRSSPESAWDSDSRRRSSDSDSDPPKAEESPPKLDTECKAIQDKKKNHTLHKIFSISLKRDQEGGKGGAKGGYGGKGKGKGGSKTPGIIVDSESERTSNDIISPRLLSPPPSNDSKYSPNRVKVKREKTNKYSDQDKPYNKKIIKDPDIRVKRELDDGDWKKSETDRGVLSLMCRLDLSRLSYIPSKGRSEEVRTRTELSDTRQRKSKRERSPDSPDRGELVIPKCDMMTNGDRSNDSCDREVREKSSKKQKTSRKRDEKNEEKAAVKSSKHSPHNKSGVKSQHKSRRHKSRDRRRSVSSLSSLSTECSRASRGHHRKRSTEEETRPASSQASSSYMEHVLTEPALTGAPPTNHERDEMRYAAPDWQPAPDWQAPPQTVYFSYFERGPENISDNEERAQDQFLAEAKRLKHMADRETEPMAQAMRYLEAVMFFLLYGNAMEAESSVEKTPFTMYRETLGLIKYISSKFENQHSSSHENIDTKLQVLSYRCQSLLHLKLYKMKKLEIKEIQKQLEDFGKKSSHASSMQPGETCGPVVGGQGTPSALSPTPSPAGSVGSVGSQSSGYNSGELRGQQQASAAAVSVPCIAVPLTIYTAMHKQTDNFGSILSCHDLWDEADALVYKGKHMDFFIDLDRYYGPLTLHSSLIDLVKYVTAGVQRIKTMSPRSNL